MNSLSLTRFHPLSKLVPGKQILFSRSSLGYSMLGGRSLRLRRPFQFTFDFDGTLTKKDTLHVVAEAGYHRQEVYRPQVKLPPWQEIVDAYMSDYSAHESTYLPTSLQRRTLSSEAAWLDSLRAVETASADRVDDAGVFDDLTMQDVEVAARAALEDGRVQLREGWAELFNAIKGSNSQPSSSACEQNDIQIVSVNWSRYFVWFVLWQATAKLENYMLAVKAQDLIHEIRVYANEIPTIVDEMSPSATPIPRELHATLRTASDKLRDTRTRYRFWYPGFSATRVYIGDSTTDLECLLMADVGICVRDEPMSSSQQELNATCDRLGVRIKSLSDFEEHGELEKKKRYVLTFAELDQLHAQHPLVIYYVHDFHEVHKWLQALDL